MTRLWRSGRLLLALTNFFWAANIVIARGVAELVPPVALTFFRWGGAAALAGLFGWRHLRADWPVLWRHRWMMLVFAATGIATYNTLVYIGLHTTTAINALLLQSAMPLFVLVWLLAVFREPPAARQAVAILISLAGVAVIAGRGSAAVLRSLSFTPGDLLILLAVVVYALYSALLRLRPRVHPMSFLSAITALGSLMLVPFALWEAATGAATHPTPGALAAIAYTCVLPSFVGYLFFNRGVELIGAARAGQFLHLMPAFGTALAILFLGESVQLYHAVGIALIATGLVLAA